tara:strand:+ start:66 stop:581 length:516 start_codon:yes stop_codon:yes gene_type:complete
MRLARFLLSGLSISLFLVATVLAGTESTTVLRLSEAVETGPNYEVFGAPMPDKTVGLSLTELIAQKQDYLGKEVRVSATITQVCQAKGCFFIAMQDEKWARITFRDYAFFVPTNTANSRVLIEGIFSEAELSSTQAQHYQADLGSRDNSADDGPSREYSIIASSVLIHKPI